MESHFKQFALGSNYSKFPNLKFPFHCLCGFNSSPLQPFYNDVTFINILPVKRHTPYLYPHSSLLAPKETPRAVSFSYRTLHNSHRLFPLFKSSFMFTILFTDYLAAMETNCRAPYLQSK